MNREKMLATRRAYYRKNRKKILASNAAWRRSNRKKVAATSRAWAQANRKKVAAYKSAWQRANYESVLVRLDTWKHAHPEKVASYRTKWRRENVEKTRMKNLKWRHANRQKWLDYNHRRRARRAVVPSAPYDFNRIVEKARGMCAYCGKTKVKLTRDHLIPLYRGGPDIEANIVPACRTCNSQKSTKIILPKFLVSQEQREFLLALSTGSR